MNTQYITFILRLRLDAGGGQDTANHRVFGSMQKVGLQEICYFDSAEKLQATLQGLFPENTVCANDAGKLLTEQSRS
jgi:hypothetical protein